MIWPPPTPPSVPPFHTPWQPDPRQPCEPVHVTSISAPGTDWLAERLFDKRIVSLTGRLDEDATNRAAASLALLDASGDGEVQLWLHGVDADVDAAATLLDTLDLMGVPLHVHCRGDVRGMAVTLLAPADRRTAAAHAGFHLREPQTSCAGPASDIATAAEHHEQQLRRLQQRIADSCRQPLDAVIDDMRGHRILTADEARDYGLIDTVTGARSAEGE
ncbi:ATP-dependent Clp protease proteolytic subunit [Rhodococcus jostii]|uniref:ATP-dependent Clp protease proteolytic subunit n=1 Tax=Rhodococcus jostii TaxID=132919 RepID=A0A1H4ZYI5_RHOJO|nr:ATP-dependent Clp protease proteolytic subunit [Rhodococcus jostii]SED35246.1 ATP-dependent Clp protease, protease subunit [Rhodococcus jostii]